MRGHTRIGDEVALFVENANIRNTRSSAGPYAAKLYKQIQAAMVVQSRIPAVLFRHVKGGLHFSPGNAYQSAVAAGYSPNTAKSKCHILARRARVKVAAALEALGCDGFSQAVKLLELREARPSAGTRRERSGTGSRTPTSSFAQRKRSIGCRTRTRRRRRKSRIPGRSQSCSARVSAA